MDTILSGSCNIRWPGGNYALPMSVYGCPEPDMASWKYGYINISFTERTDLYEKTLGSIGWNHSFLMLLGPYGPYSYQLNFCTKDPASSTIAATDTPMWPPGKYSIYGTAAGCPEGRDILTLNAPIATKVVCFSRLLKCLRSLYGKQSGPRSDCYYRSSLFWVHPVCFYT